MAAGENPKELIRRIRFRHLHMLLELQRLGTLRATAQVLNQTQPALSKTLGEIEQAFGFELFVRGPRGLAPSPRGEVVLRGASVLLAELGHMFAEASHAASRPKETLRIGALPFAAHGLVPGLLRTIHKTSPDLYFEIREGSTTQLFEATAKGDIDAAICTYSKATLSAAQAEQLQFLKIAEERFVVVVPKSHPLCRRKSVNWKHLAEERWVLPRPESLLRNAVEARFLAEGLSAPSPVVVSNSPTTNVKLVAEGVGLTCVPASTIGDFERAGKVRRLHIEPEIEAVAVALFHRQGAIAEGRLKGLRQALAST